MCPASRMQHCCLQVNTCSTSVTVMKCLLYTGPKQNPQPYPLSKLAQTMWSDSETDAIEYLSKAGLEPEQASSGGWQLVLHRSLKVDAQAASFRQHSARLCNQQNPVRSQNVQEQGQQAEAAVQALLAGSGRQLSLPTAAPPRAAGLGSDAGQQPGVPETPQAHTRQVGIPCCWRSVDFASHASPDVLSIKPCNCLLAQQRKDVSSQIALPASFTFFCASLLHFLIEHCIALSHLMVLPQFAV